MHNDLLIIGVYTNNIRLRTYMKYVVLPALEDLSTIVQHIKIIYN